MIARKFRFHGHGALKFVLTRGKLTRCRSLVVKYSQNPRRHSPRVAVIVSKKIFKHAVDRNRTRRRTYEIARRALRTFAKPGVGVDLVITIYNQNVKTMPSEELIQQLVPPLRDILTNQNTPLKSTSSKT
ncbi:MAG: ribonuclease P protein component [Candidatus Nanoperiomorbaceae bacterium]